MWAAIFPGQGSQHPGMGQFLFDNFNEAKQLFEEASDCLKLDFKKLCFEGPDKELALTHNTQPALLLVSVTTHKILSSLVPIPYVASAGHSVGEYASMVSSGVITFTDALLAVRQRGEFMQAAVPVGKGAMLAVMGLSPIQVDQLYSWACEKSGLTPVEPANFNAPGQIVISGSAPLIEWLQENIDKSIFDPPIKKLRLIPLKVSAPFHCSMMKPAEEQMRQVLENIEFKPAALPIVQNTTAQPVQDPQQLRENLIQQISSPVRWVECVEELKKLGVTNCIELGSGKVLSGLVKKIDSDHLKTFNVNSIDDIKSIEALWKN